MSKLSNTKVPNSNSVITIAFGTILKRLQEKSFDKTTAVYKQYNLIIHQDRIQEIITF